MSYYDKDNTNAAARIGRYPGPGLNSVAEYQQAGRPFLKMVAPTAAHSDGDGGTETFAGNDKIKTDVVTVEFPFITKRVTIKNLSLNDAYVYFTSLMVPAEDLGANDKAGDAAAAEDRTVLDPAPTARGDVITVAELDEYHQAVADARPDSAVKANGHYYTLEPDETVEMNLKCKRVYIAGSGDLRVYAELTNIVHPYNLDLRGIEGISGGIAGTVKS